MARATRYLVNLNRRIAEHGEPTYVRLMAEMNQANNGYSGVRPLRPGGRAARRSLHDGRSSQAWRRSTLILRGGPVAEIEREAAAGSTSRPCGYERRGAPAPRRSRWPGRPQTRGTPDIPANMPRAYWPGRRVDVDLDRHRLLQPFPQLPLARRLLPRLPRQAVRVRRMGAVGWRRPRRSCTGCSAASGAHPRVRMAVYNQGALTNGPVPGSTGSRVRGAALLKARARASPLPLFLTLCRVGPA